MAANAAQVAREAEGRPEPTSPKKWKGIAKRVGFVVAGAGVACAVGAGVVLATPVVLGAVGFTSAGIAGGSMAASMMSAAAIANGGGVAAGSAIAICQSIGAVGGLSAAASAATVGGTTAAGTAGTTLYQVIKHRLEKKGENSNRTTLDGPKIDDGAGNPPGGAKGKGNGADSNNGGISNGNGDEGVIMGLAVLYLKNGKSGCDVIGLLVEGKKKEVAAKNPADDDDDEEVVLFLREWHCIARGREMRLM